MKTLSLTVAGAAAGAAGATVLNIVTYLDMALRGRPASSAPEDVVERIADVVDAQIPGDPDVKQARLTGLGALTGLVVGVGVGGLLGLARAIGFRPPIVVSGLVATAVAMVGSDGPIAAAGVSDPLTWKPKDWASDVIPHLAYGFTTAAVLQALDRSRR